MEVSLSSRLIKEDELTNEEHIETAADLILKGLRPER